MALNNVYNYIRKYIDRDFSKKLNAYANYECDDLIDECVMMIDYYDHNCPAFIYYREINNIIIFNDFDIALCNARPTQLRYFETTLDRVLDILIMQDTLVNDDIEILNEFIN